MEMSVNAQIHRSKTFNLRVLSRDCYFHLCTVREVPKQKCPRKERLGLLLGTAPTATNHSSFAPSRTEQTICSVSEDQDTTHVGTEYTTGHSKHKIMKLCAPVFCGAKALC